MNYEECLVYLDQIQNAGIKFGLENVRTILASFGNPHRCYPSLHVAGTNGKGSVCAMLSRILMVHGCRVGLFTSPHLVHVRERIRIDHEPLGKESFSLHLTLLRDRIAELMAAKKLLSPPTYFELMSCLAFLSFKTEMVDTAVLEVGMGGRYDATNVVRPLISAITTISMEHQEYLGDTPARIASEKAGIIKPGVPVVCGVEEEEAYETIRKRAEELEAPFIGVFANGRRLFQRKSGNAYCFSYRTDGGEYVFTPSLAGAHQGRNAAVAIAVSEELNKMGRKLEKTGIIRALETTPWPGRLEIVSERPLVLVDGAHNEEGARALRAYIQDCLSQAPVLVFAAMRDKRIEAMADLLFPFGKKVVITRFPYHKAAAPEDVADLALKYADRILVEPDLAKAVTAALEEATPEGVVLATGSLFLVGEVKKIFSEGRTD